MDQTSNDSNLEVADIHRGLDIGTNMLVAASMGKDGTPKFKMQRDAFYRIIPKSAVNKNSIKMSLEKRKANYIIDDAAFIVVGEDALDIAIERHDKVERPLQKGVISPKNKKSLPMLKLIIKDLLGNPSPGSKVVYSVPAAPADTNFDIIYHTEIMGNYLKEIGYDSSPINEAFAIALSELLDDGLTGVCVSCLVPGTKIYSNKGIVAIETVKSGDKVITHKGRLRRINKVITKEFKGMCTKIQLQGYSNTTELYKFVDDHELYVNRDGKWEWVGCESVKVGDIVGEPIIENNNFKSKLDTACDNSEQIDRLFTYEGFCCTKVQKIEYEEYSGKVYDLQVEEDHSFSGPYLTIHNCGAGMANTVVIHQGDPLVEFSLTRSGDYIDKSVGQALDMSPSLIQQEKEAGIDLYNPVGEIAEAISVYYGAVIKYTLENIAYELNKRKKDLPIFRDPVPLVVSGGLTLADGFVNKVQEVSKNIEFPINIGNIRRAAEPMRSVAHGCLLAAHL